MARIGIVADSTCDLGPDEFAKLGVVMVPLKVHFGDDTFRDWIDFTPDEYYPKLVSSPIHPTTSQPSPSEFGEVYDRLAAEGVEGIVVVTISALLSGTYESATLAAKDSPVPVRVVDTLSTSAAMGFVVDEAVAARDGGGDLDAVEAAARWAVENIELHFVVDTLDYLVKGGRAGKAQALAASLLNIKPVLYLNGGVIEPFKKVKGSRKAYQEMAAHVMERQSQVGPLKVMIIHAVAPELAEQLADELRAAGFKGDITRIVAIGSVIGTHVGPKAAGVASIPVR